MLVKVRKDLFNVVQVGSIKLLYIHAFMRHIFGKEIMICCLLIQNSHSHIAG